MIESLDKYRVPLAKKPCISFAIPAARADKAFLLLYRLVISMYQGRTVICLRAQS